MITKNFWKGKVVFNYLMPLFILIALFLPSYVFSQAKTVTGKVIGTDGTPIPGVTILEKGTNKGSAANSSGEFSINVSSANASLEFSSLGYQSQTIALNGRSNITVEMKGGAAKELEQVVVIGYGTANKRDLTGSIVKIAGKEIADKPNTNPIASLQSKVAGLSVVNSGTPGAQPDIRIRGTTSIGQVHPLYVVDGIFNDNIDYINPNDIESIEILKDPSSLAIFGIKGATGVIAITTKKAKSGQTIVNLNTSYGVKNLVDKIKFVNGEQFKTLFAEENANNGITTPFDYTGLTANTDWIDAVTRRAIINTNNLSVAGGTDKNKFNFGLGYTRDQGLIRHEQLERLLVSFSDEFKVNKNIKLGVNFYGSRQKNPYDATTVLDDARKVVPLVSSGTKPFRIKDPYSADTINTNLYSGLNTGLQTSGVVNPLLR